MNKGLQKELERWLLAGERVEPISKLGFFSQPIRLTEGPFSGQVLKRYKPQRRQEDLESLIHTHQTYIDALRKLDVAVPATTMHCIESRKLYYPVVLQESFENDELVRSHLESGDNIDAYTKVIIGLLQQTIHFLQRRDHEQLTIGFHPTTRNYAIRGGQWWYFDTFPPMMMGQRDLNGLILQYSPAPSRLAWMIPKSWLNRVSNEYYDPVKMLSGIVGSACRLRPADASIILDRCQRTLFDILPDSPWSPDIVQMLKTPPQLNGTWLFFRKLLGKEGAPNVGK